MRKQYFTSALALCILLSASVACVEYKVPDRRPSGGDEKEQQESGTATFTFSAAEAQYASLKETVILKVNNPGKIEVTVDWGDGNKENGTSDTFKHSYNFAGNYTVKASASENSQEWPLEIGPLTALSVALGELYSNPDKVWVMAHRSHTQDNRIPENSVSAVAAAIADGADVIETDTHRTADGFIVISHDESIDKHTDGKGKITSMTLNSIRSYHLTDRDGNVTSELMPTLEEFLMAARGKVYVNLDYSPRSASTEEVLKVVKKLGMVQQVFMFCKNATFVNQVFSSDPEANAYVASEDYSALLAGKNRYFLQVGWNSDQTQKSECVGRCKTAYGKGVLCSVNLLHVNHSYIPEYSIDRKQLSSLFELYPECQMIQTDCPKELAGILREQGRR